MQTETALMRIIIVDDEEKSRRTLKKMVESYIEQVEVVAVASNVLDAIKHIQQHNPDVVFLDIEMPAYSGFKLIEYFNEIDFEIIFTTAYEQYAIKAYKSSALGYLLKPIDIDELIEVFKKVRQRANKKYLKKRSDKQSLDEAERKVVFPAPNGYVFLKTYEICYLKSSGRYTDIILTSGEQLLTTLNLKDCCEKLTYSTFMRVHRSFVINLSYIQNYSKGRSSFIIMDNEDRVDVGPFYKEDLSRIIDLFLK